MGIQIQSLNVANENPPSFDFMANAVENSDIVLVSGGNTQYAIDRWRYLGLDKLLKEASLDGSTVLCGGSAGAICWFDSGHSDSWDPDTYRLAMLDKFRENSGGDDDDNGGGKRKANKPKGKSVARSTYFNDVTNSKNIAHENSIGNPEDGDSDDGSSDGNNSKSWEYIRVEGLSILPGLICPHYDRIQSNGVPRMTDFNSMMERHSKELGIGIDHHAALEINGENFRILSIPGEKGSVSYDYDGNDGELGREKGIPGAWIKYVDEDGIVQSMVCPKSGKVRDLLQEVKDPERHFLLDDRVELCRKENHPPLE